VEGSNRRLYNEELHNLYSSPNVVRVIKLKRMRWSGHAARTEEKYKILFGKPERWKEALGRPRSRWENNIWKK
jgi:hypothetical protein